MDSTENNEKRPIPWKVYLVHSLSTWSDNMWWFASGLYMMKLAPGTLRLTAVYGFVISVTVMCFGASVGNWIDKTRRIKAARTFLAIRNLCGSLCAIGVSFFLWLYASELASSTEGIKDSGDSNMINISNSNEKQVEFEDSSSYTSTSPETQFPYFETSKFVTIIGVIVFSAIIRLASSGTIIIIQKDLTVVISNNDTDYLSKMNAILRTIELTTTMLAPIIYGQLFNFIGYIWTGAFIAGSSLLSFVCEYMLLNGIYSQYPRLAHKFKAPDDEEKEATYGDGPQPKKEDIEEKECQPRQDGENQNHSVWDKIFPRVVKEAFFGWKTYFLHPVRNAGLGLAMLYMSVLAFNNIICGYAIMQNVSESILGILVAVSAIVGVLGSVAYPFLKKCLGLERTGLLGMFLFVSPNLLSVLSNFIPGAPFLENWMDNVEKVSISDVNKHSENMDHDSPSNVEHVTALMTGIIMGRFGLWVVDLTITQIIQERVEEDRRGVINGVQDSLNNSLDLLKCILVILLPGAKDFGGLIILSYISISSGWLLYAIFCRNQRGHLFHLNRLIPCRDQNELHTTSHWPFCPEPENKESTYIFEENGVYRLSNNQIDEDNTLIIKSSGNERLEKMSCCNA